MQDLMCLLKDQSKVIGLQRTIEGLNDAIKSLNKRPWSFKKSRSIDIDVTKSSINELNKENYQKMHVCMVLFHKMNKVWVTWSFWEGYFNRTLSLYTILFVHICGWRPWLSILKDEIFFSPIRIWTMVPWNRKQMCNQWTMLAPFLRIMSPVQFKYHKLKKWILQSLQSGTKVSSKQSVCFFNVSGIL